MNKKGFTLVEILAIIAVLGVMVILTFPSIGGSNDTKKEKELEKIIGIIENSAKAYFSFNSDEYKVNINTLIEEEYIVSNMINPKTNEKLEGCVRKVVDKDNIYTYTYGDCESITVSVSFVLGDRTIKETHKDGEQIELEKPERDGYVFKGWELVKGNSVLKGNTLIVGTTETIIHALWENASTLTVDLDGGSVSKSDNGIYSSGTVIELKEPTKTGYTFTGWEKVSGNGVLSGNIFTMGTGNAVVKATWEGNKYTVTLDANGGILETATIEVTYGDEYGKMPIPTKEGYIFTGWYTELNGVIRVESTTKVIRTENYTLYAGWLYSEFAYSGNEQEFIVPLSGYYKFEAWGAQGGSHNSTYKGGYGGYSTGLVYLEEGETIYINVGGTTTGKTGGYNGGANGGSGTGYGGGGATHVAKKSGLLSELENFKEDIIIVAGGGGGADQWSSCAYGGHGGGYEGGAGSITGSTSMTWSLGGTQTAGGVCNTSGAIYASKSGTFGLGGDASSWGGGGGGGYYGGAGGNSASEWASGGGGGSGYVDGLLEHETYKYSNMVSDTAISFYSKSGNGYLKIYYIIDGINLVNTESGVDFSRPTEYVKKVLTSGYYKLEVWGAQGGSHNSTYKGGYGGYSTGLVYLEEGETIYINVGGTTTGKTGGYNGGANGGSGTGYGGGGATHVAKKSGLLSELENFKEDIIIVAGGGGGADEWASYAYGGHGGGYEGGAGSKTGSSSMTWSLGGTQTAGGVCNTSGAIYASKSGTFGSGGDASSWGGGGGGGYYGGAGGNSASPWASGGGGGSGYIGNTLLTNKVMYCYNCTQSTEESTKTISTTNVSATAMSNYAKSGDGFARITYLGETQ